MKHGFRGVTDQETGNAGSHDRAHDDQVDVVSLGEVSDDFGRVALDQVNVPVRSRLFQPPIVRAPSHSRMRCVKYWVSAFSRYASCSAHTRRR
jgi:hypothetical protein